MIALYTFIGFVAGFIAGIVCRDAMVPTAGTFHIDFSDERKELCKVELDMDLDEIMEYGSVKFNVKEKHENDFYGGK